ncbi:hypothetical protein HNP48_003331 [Acidovorax soli]|uniref:Uncharacterized protein n=1 Tax=Acidovorax soli TaxID=592050 RepID=A0A7X0UAK4_9BURK|nr:hypothetical protein [Acidovorax soli]
MRPDPAVKAKAHPKWREDTSVRCTLPSLLSMGRLAVAPVEHCRLQQVVKEPGPRWVDALGGSAGAAKRWNGGKKKSRNEKGPEPPGCRASAGEIGRENALGLLPCVATSARGWSGILETIAAQPLRLVAIALQVRTGCHALLRCRQSFGQGRHGCRMRMGERRQPAHGHGALAGAAEDGGADGVHDGLSAKSGSVVVQRWRTRSPDGWGL